MEDKEIVRLYWERNELAIKETSNKYGRYLYTIAYNILLDKEDADESVNDSYYKTWECIPPHFPEVLATFIGKITRRISLNKWHSRTRKKRGGGQISLALEELDECLVSENDVEKTIEHKELLQTINTFLGQLSETERDLFVCRYWFFASIQELSKKFAFSESKTKSMLFRTREKLKNYLEEEGYL